jgi:hypothetical protein
VGVATQDPHLYQGVNVADKRIRVANYHRNTIAALAELMGACGFPNPAQVKPSALFRRVTRTDIRSYEEIYAPDHAGKKSALYPGPSVNN